MAGTDKFSLEQASHQHFIFVQPSPSQRILGPRKLYRARLLCRGHAAQRAAMQKCKTASASQQLPKPSCSPPASEGPHRTLFLAQHSMRRSGLQGAPGCCQQSTCKPLKLIEQHARRNSAAKAGGSVSRLGSCQATGHPEPRSPGSGFGGWLQRLERLERLEAVPPARWRAPVPLLLSSCFWAQDLQTVLHSWHPFTA